MCYVESGDMHCIFGPSAILFMDVYPWCQSAIFVVLTYQIVLQLDWSVWLVRKARAQNIQLCHQTLQNTVGGEEKNKAEHHFSTTHVHNNDVFCYDYIINGFTV